MPENYPSRSQLRRHRQRQHFDNLPPLDPKDAFGYSTGSGIVDFGTTNLQRDCGFLSLLPVEIRDKIYLEVWRQAGLSQHILEYSAGGEVPYYGHARCVTEFDTPQGENSWPESLPPLVAYQRWRLEAASWTKTCFTCIGRFDHGWPSAPIERQTPFLPMLLTCKQMHLEALDSIAHNIRFVFEYCMSASRFLGIRRPPMVHQLRHLLITDGFRVACNQDRDWSWLVKVIQGLPNLRTLYFWMEYTRSNWRNDKPRLVVKNPRLCVCFASVPAHIDLKVTIPCDSLTPHGNPETSLSFVRFISERGGLIDGATMPMMLGDGALTA